MHSQPVMLIHFESIFQIGNRTQLVKIQAYEDVINQLSKKIVRFHQPISDCDRETCQYQSFSLIAFLEQNFCSVF